VSGADAGEPQVAWIAIDEGAVVLAADGSEIGKVKEVAGDEEHDIFDGLVVAHSRFDADRYVPSERVTAIWPDKVATSLTRDEAEHLPAYREPRTTEWHVDEGGGRLRRAWRDLFGGR
jgi:hypothetical protein